MWRQKQCEPRAPHRLRPRVPRPQSHPCSLLGHASAGLYRPHVISILSELMLAGGSWVSLRGVMHRPSAVQINYLADEKARAVMTVCAQPRSLRREMPQPCREQAAAACSGTWRKGWGWIQPAAVGNVSPTLPLHVSPHPGPRTLPGAPQLRAQAGLACTKVQHPAQRGLVSLQGPLPSPSPASSPSQVPCFRLQCWKGRVHLCPAVPTGTKSQVCSPRGRMS